MRACIFQPNRDHAPLHRFVAGMLRDWFDQSSLQKDGLCCPDRTVESVVLQYDRAAHTPGNLVVVENGGDIVATMLVICEKPWQRSAHGELLNVHPTARACGAGRLLLSFTVAMLARGGMRRLQLETWIDNEPALALFRATGSVVRDGTSGRTVMTENWLPKVLQSADDKDLYQDVAAGRFRASAERDEGFVRMHLSRYGNDSDWIVLAS